MVPALVRFGGSPEVDDNGNLLYRFPSLQLSGAARVRVSSLLQGCQSPLLGYCACLHKHVLLCVDQIWYLRPVGSDVAESHLLHGLIRPCQCASREAARKSTGRRQRCRICGSSRKQRGARSSAQLPWAPPTSWAWCGAHAKF